MVSPNLIVENMENKYLDRREGVPGKRFWLSGVEVPSPAHGIHGFIFFLISVIRVYQW
jgi:hypothetical protein